MNSTETQLLPDCEHGPLQFRYHPVGSNASYWNLYCLTCNEIGQSSKEILLKINNEREMIQSLRKLKNQFNQYVFTEISKPKGLIKFSNDDIVNAVHMEASGWRRRGNESRWRRGAVDSELISLLNANRKLIEPYEYSKDGNLSPDEEKEFDARDKEIDRLHRTIEQIDDLVESDYLKLKLYEWVKSRESNKYQDDKTMPCFSCSRKRSPDVYFLDEVHPRHRAVLCWPCECEYGLQPTAVSNWPVGIPPPDCVKLETGPYQYDGPWGTVEKRKAAGHD